MMRISGRTASSLAMPSPVPLGGQRDQVRIEARLGEHLAGDPYGQGQRQHRARMRLDQHRVAGGEGGEEARIAVPRGEGVAADQQGDAAAAPP